MEAEYKDKCTNCGVKGHAIARNYHSKIKGKWHWLCKNCWQLREDYINARYGKEIPMERKIELRKAFIDEHFDMDGLVELEFITKDMVGDYEAIEKRIVTFFELDSLYEWMKDPIRVHISHADGTGETKTIGGIYG
jgi:hypothetical protein